MELSIYGEKNVNQAAGDLIAICRRFGIFERDQICCRTVTLQQCVTMQALFDKELEVAQLAKQVGNSASAMTRLVDGLHKSGWVKRTRSQSDKRRVLISLTDKGREETEELIQITEHTVAAIVATIPEDKRDQVRESLHLLRVAVDLASQTAPACLLPASEED